MDRMTIKKIETFFKQKFNNKKIKIEGRANKNDSADVLIDDEFIGVVFEDNLRKRGGEYERKPLTAQETINKMGLHYPKHLSLFHSFYH